MTSVDGDKKRRRRSRWEEADAGDARARTRDDGGDDEPRRGPGTSDGGDDTERRDCRRERRDVQLPSSMLAEHSAPAAATPEVHFLFRELGALNRRLFAGAPYDRDESNDAREPAPVYDDKGVRVNTREAVEREKFHRRRMELLEEICLKCPTFRPPADYKPNKRTAKLVIRWTSTRGITFSV